MINMIIKNAIIFNQCAPVGSHEPCEPNPCHGKSWERQKRIDGNPRSSPILGLVSLPQRERGTDGEPKEGTTRPPATSNT
jgi:hypothetical protein